MSFSASVADLVEQSEFDLVAKADRWPRVPIGAVARIINGYPFKSDRFTDRDEGVPIIRIRDVTVGRSKTNYAGEVPEGFWVDDGDLVVGMDGDFNSRIWAGGRGLLNQRVCKIVPDTAVVDLSFLAAILPGYLSLINEATHSITVKHLSSGTLAETPIPLPPLPEQRRIVAKLDRLSARSRAARDHLARTAKLAARAKQAILAAAFDAASAGGECGVMDLVSEPIRNGLSIRGQDHPPGVPALRLSALREGAVNLRDVRYLPITAERAAPYRLRAGDVLVSRGNGNLRLLAIASVVPETDGSVIYPDTAFRIRISPSRGDPRWFALMWSAPQARSQIESLGKTTAGIWKVSQGDLRQVRLPRLSSRAQLEVVRRIQAAFARIDRLTTEAARAAHLLDRLDERLLAKAFRGELVPQDPADEPAAQLLAHLCANRSMLRKRARGAG